MLNIHNLALLPQWLVHLSCLSILHTTSYFQVDYMLVTFFVQMLTNIFCSDWSSYYYLFVFRCFWLKTKRLIEQYQTIIQLIRECKMWQHSIVKKLHCCSMHAVLHAINLQQIINCCVFWSCGEDVYYTLVLHQLCCLIIFHSKNIDDTMAEQVMLLLWSSS